MKKIPLPLAKEFFSIIENYEINNWQAKDFWGKMNHSLYIDKQLMRKKMYAGIRVLVICNFFNIQKSSSNKRINIYTENKRLKEFRKEIIQNQLNEALNGKHHKMIEEVKIKENEIDFIKSLCEEIPSIEKHLDKYNKKYIKEMDILRSNIRVIEKILNIV